jgi:hypothetical protein
MAVFGGLRQAYDCRDTGGYDESHVYAWTQEIDVALVTSEHHSLGTIVNVGERSLVAITLEFEHSAVWYRNALGQRPVEDIVRNINWCGSDCS